jgi:hypothetical protein
MKKIRRQYFVVLEGPANAYSLMYADTEEELKQIPKEAKRRTRIQAIGYAMDERHRREDDSRYAWIADDAIYPAGLTDWEKDNLPNNPEYYKKGYIWEKKKEKER